MPRALCCRADLKVCSKAAGRCRPHLAVLTRRAADPAAALVADPATAKFVATTTPNAPKGSQNSLIGVDPNTKGPTAYAKTPAGAGLPAHWHSYAEYTALLSGKGTLTLDGKQHEVSQ